MTEPVHFGAFDPHAEVERTYRNLPHWFQPRVATFITFRTADSLPQAVLRQFERGQQDWLNRHGTHMVDLASHSDLDREFRRYRDRQWHGHLDRGYGDCVLKRPDVAAIVGDSLRFFDGDRYDLDSFIVMPNHVHVLVQFRHPTTLRQQTRSWLQYTARRINELIGARGPFWQSEPFDHLVRSPEQFSYLQRYIAENPVKARLADGMFLYWSRET
ncbi:MAG: transposase [Planctomycetaceae bacterium]